MDASVSDLQHRFEAFASRFSTLAMRQEIESVPWREALGRILARDVLADRDSPAIDVSAMDGYAVRLSDVLNRPATKPLKVSGTITAGSAPLAMQPDACIRLFTGAPVPSEADCVIKREETIEASDSITFRSLDRTPIRGENVRRRGENVKKNEKVLAAGTEVTTATLAGLSTFGISSIPVYRTLRVSILNTGDEIHDIDSMSDTDLPFWQIRDSNGPFLESLIASRSYLKLQKRGRIVDDLKSVTTAIQHALEASDVLLLTGGVSMGDTDHVPEAVRLAGGEVAIHKIPIRPGKPFLAGIGPRGQMILGLPGNPVSVAVTATRFAVPLLRYLAGGELWQSPCQVAIENSDDRTLGLVWYRLVQLVSPGLARFNESRGSGDVASLATSHGFVELPIDQSGAGPWDFYSW